MEVRREGGMKMEQVFFTPVEWLYKDEDGKGVSNFCPEILGRTDIVDHNGAEIEVLVKLRLHFADGTCNECEVSLSECDKINWSAINQRCIVNPEYHKANERIGVMLRSGIDKVPAETRILLDGLGIKRIGDEVVFVAGNRVIPRVPDNNSGLKYEVAKLPFRMDIDLNLSPEETFSGMKELISLSHETGRVLVAHTVSGIVRTAFKEVGFTPCTVLVVVGKSGMLKSHYVPHLVQLYNRNAGIKAVTRFNSSQRFIEDILCEYCECTAVIDDLHSAESRGIKKRNEATAEEIIRRISDDTGRGHKEGNELVQKDFRGNVIFIGEYNIGKESTVPRALIVGLTERPDGAVLDKYQRKCPLIVSTFYYYFIQWYVCHYDTICNEIDKRLTTLRETTVNSHLHGRLCDTKFYLQTSYMFFLEFCKESDFISEEDAVDEYAYFCSQLDVLVSAQQARFKGSNGEETIDYLALIKKIYKQDGFCIAKRKKDFKQNKHDGVIHYECLCLRGSRLEQKIKNIDVNFNLGDCIKDLLAQNALRRVEQKNTVQINGTGGKRFYAVRLDKLN